MLLAALAGAAPAMAAVPLQTAHTPTARTLTERLAELEQQGRWQPNETAKTLSELIANLGDSQVQERIEALVLMGRLWALLGESSATEQVALQLEGIARSHGHALADASSGLVRAYWLRYHGSAARADRMLQAALDKLPATTPGHMRVRFLAMQGRCKEKASKLDEAVRAQQQAIRLADMSSPLWMRSELRSDLTYTLYLAHELEQALAINQEAGRLGEQSGDGVALFNYWTSEAIVRTELKDGAGTLHAFQMAIAEARRAGSKRDEGLALANIADYYLIHGEFATALEASQRAYRLAEENRDLVAQAIAISNVGLAEISLHRKEEGLRHVRQGLAIDERTGMLTIMANRYAESGQYLERAGYLQDALEAFHQYRKMADEASQSEQQQAIVELQERYQQEGRQRELQLLERNNRIKEQQLVHRSLQQWLWVGASSVGVLLLGVGLLLMRRVRDSNAALADSNAQLAVLSERDTLTGLANRRHFHNAMRRHEAAGGLAGALFLIDIDHFKQINDRYGHASGDLVLVEVARRLRSVLRDDDLVVRWGGEEFLVLAGPTGPEPVDALAQRLLVALAGLPVQAGEHRLAVSASIGYASFPLEPAEVPTTWERAVEVVDTAMYLAKTHGRNRAYGVRLLATAVPTELDLLLGRLEEAWRSGEVALTLQQGPALREAMA